MKTVDVVFSFRNEEDVLPLLLERLSKLNSESNLNYQFNFIFVNDQSTDNSIAELNKYLNKIPITIINLSRRFGVSSGVLAGLNQSTADFTVYMDCDLQDPPEEILRMLRETDKGVDVVHMKRTNRLGESRAKMALTKLAYRLIKRISYIQLETNVGDFKLISKRVREYLIELNEFDPYFRGLSVWIGFKQVTLEYERQARPLGKTHFSIFGLGPMFELLRGVTSFSNFMLIISIFTTSIGILAGIMFPIIIVIKYVFSISINLQYGLLSAIFVLLITLVTNFGILGIYVSKIFSQGQNRPKYIIESIINSKI
jgi:dolichol-phosphate mannosyltransferase